MYEWMDAAGTVLGCWLRWEIVVLTRREWRWRFTDKNRRRGIKTINFRKFNCSLAHTHMYSIHICVMCMCICTLIMCTTGQSGSLEYNKGLYISNEGQMFAISDWHCWSYWLWRRLRLHQDTLQATNGQGTFQIRYRYVLSNACCCVVVASCCLCVVYAGWGR